MRVVIAFGSNVGDAKTVFAKAFQLLQAEGLRMERISSFIETEPVDCPPGTPMFRNGVLTAFWDGSALDLLTLCQRTEVICGRPREHGFHTPRTLDLDIILFGSEHYDLPKLKIPHPRAKSREFVLTPLREIAPELVDSL